MLNPDLSLPLPTLASHDVDASQLPSAPEQIKSIARRWLSDFAACASTGSVDELMNLLHVDSYWKDILVMTWDFRTFSGADRIRTFLNDRLENSKLQKFDLEYEEFTELQRPSPDLAWIQFSFRFDARGSARGVGVIRLVPTVPGLLDGNRSKAVEWKAHTVFTSLDELKHHPESVGALRQQDPQPGSEWQKRKQEELDAVEDPTVLIAGGAQAGMVAAARLKCLGVRVLVIEKEDRIGGNWRKRYDALCLHDPVWYDHMPYMPFPSTWPTYTPALKMANWLESYAQTLDLPIWLSATVSHAEYNDKSGLWEVLVKRADQPDRLFRVRHFVLATGIFGGQPKIPALPGRELFEGTVLHSLDYKRASDFSGKKTVVVGAATSGHDISADLANAGMDVTMVQRGSTHVLSTKPGHKLIMKGLYEEGGPPTELADLLGASYPNLLVVRLAPRRTEIIEELDRELLDGLRKRGFKLTKGDMDCGPSLTAWDRGGGYYLDVGASQMIIDGKIKLKNDSVITSFNSGGLQFADGSTLEADVIIFATGFGAYRDSLVGLLPRVQLAKLKPAWGLDTEGELQGCYRDMGLPRLWCMMGNLAFCRFHSKHLALQIKAMEEGLFDGRRY